MKISGVQVFWLMFSMEIGMTMLLTVSPSVLEAKQDAWISCIIAGVIVLGITFIATKLSLIHSNQTLIEFSQTILGKWLGTIIVIPYFVMWYSVTGIILRESSDFLHLALFHKTPLFVIAFTMVMLMVYVTYQGGIESIGRCSEVFGPIIFLVILLTFILSFTNIHWQRLLPMYADSGAMSILKGAIPPAAFLGESVMMMMLTCFMEEPNKSPSRSMWGVGIASLFVCIATVMVLTTFGPSLSSKMWFPYFDLVRYISTMEFIQNIESIVIVIWVLSIFIKLSLYLFITSYGTAQWLGIKNWKKVIWIVAPIVLILAMWYPNIDVSSIDYPKKFWTPYVVPINIVGIPLLLWIIGGIRKKWY